MNLGLQCVRLACKEMDQEFERKASKVTSFKNLRHFAEKDPGFCDSAVDSMTSVKICLMQVSQQLKLK